MGRYPMVSNADALVDEVHADIVTFQIASLDQEATIRILGAEVLPRLRE